VASEDFLARQHPSRRIDQHHVIQPPWSEPQTRLIWTELRDDVHQ
jgi:hypothetical protein